MSIQVNTLALENLMVLRGKSLAELVQKMDLPLPDLFKYEMFDNQAFIANLGTSEILINHPAFKSQELGSQQYAFQRGDAVLSLSGDWRLLMSEVCIYDFRQARHGDLLMVLVAGVSVWMLIPEDNSPLILGCDPTYGHYLLETLHNQINQSPFLN
ncbi:MAG: hypothetical protein R3254_10640 [Thiomicrorhabdus sp.]|nr:hypothetical protein [Thiomicrorhabdus sp.]